MVGSIVFSSRAQTHFAERRETGMALFAGVTHYPRFFITLPRGKYFCLTNNMRMIYNLRYVEKPNERRKYGQP
jgi:hypothetical protein